MKRKDIKKALRLHEELLQFEEKLGCFQQAKKLRIETRGSGLDVADYPVPSVTGKAFRAARDAVVEMLTEQSNHVRSELEALGVTDAGASVATG